MLIPSQDIVNYAVAITKQTCNLRVCALPALNHQHLRWKKMWKIVFSCPGSHARQGQGVPGTRWTQRPHSPQTNSWVGQVLQEPVRWFRPAPMDRSNPVFHCLFYPGEYSGRARRRQCKYIFYVLPLNSNAQIKFLFKSSWINSPSPLTNVPSQFQCLKVVKQLFKSYS